MRKFYYLMGILTSGLNLAQISKVGINTTNPTEVLDVNGTIRFRELPLNGTPNTIYNGSSTKASTFSGKRTLVVDENGTLGILNGLPNIGPSLGSFSSGNLTANATNSTQTLDLRNVTDIPNLYVIDDQSNTSSGYYIIVKMPNNIAGNTGRIVRFMSMPAYSTNLTGLRFEGNIGNRTTANVNGMVITNNSSVVIGCNNISRQETVITFYEINGKWFLDRNIAKAN